MSDTAGYEPIDLLRSGAAAAPFYVSGEDNLRTIVRTSVVVTVTVEGRFLDRCGTITPFVHNFTIATVTRAAVTNDARLGEGWILSIAARVTTGTPQVGQTFVQLRVVRGNGAAAINIGTLAQGYATESDDLAWPNSLVRSSVEGPGVFLRSPIASPGAGGNFLTTVPARTRWRPTMVNFQLVTSAVAGNREVVIAFDDGAAVIALIPAGVTQIASETRTYTFFHAAPRGAGTISLHVIAPLPMLTMMAGWDLLSTVSGILAGDQLSVISVTVEEWIED